MSESQSVASVETRSSRMPLAGRPWLLAFLIVLLILVIGGVILWLKRASIAGHYLSNWCAEQNIRCDATFAQLNLDNVRLENIRVESENEVPLEVGAVAVDLNWLGFLQPEVLKVKVDAPIIKASLQDGGITLHGLEDLVPGETSQSDAPDQALKIPELDIQDGQVFLSTNAGELAGKFELIGRPLDFGTAQIRIEPAELQRGEDVVALSSANVDLMFQDGAVVGTIDLAVEQVNADQIVVEDAIVLAKLAEQGNQIAFEMTGNLARFSSEQFAGENVQIASTAGLRMIDEFSVEAMLNALGKMTLHVDGENITYDAFTFGVAELNTDLVMSAEGGLEGPIALEVRDFKSPDLATERLGVTGEIYADTDVNGRQAFAGEIVTNRLQLSSGLRRGLVASLELPDPADGHARQLRSSVSRALADFDVGLALNAERNGDDWAIMAPRPTSLKSASNLTLSVDPALDDRWLRMTPELAEFSGKLSVSGGGAPRIDTFADISASNDGRVQVAFNNFMLAPWTADGITLQAEIPSLDLVLGANFGVEMNGEVKLSGDISGLQVAPTRLIGQVSAVQGAEGWRVQTQQNSCIGFDTKGIGTGTVKLDATTLSLCPVDGRFVRQENGESVGRIDLGDLSIPFQTNDSSGVFGVTDAALEWFAGDGIRLFVNGDRFSLPLQFPEDDLTIDGENPVVEVALDGGPARIKTTFGHTEFGGSMVPAKVASDNFVFDAAATSAGIDGRMTASRVHIEDLNDDPIYQPLIAELTASLTDGVFHMTGPIRTRARGIQIANTKMDLHLAELNGTANVEMLPLTFAQGGFQPVDLSELLRGVLINASGGMTGGADFEIRDGALSGAGHVDFKDLIFDTFTAGTVSGVNGRLTFTDILDLTTPPGQEISIGFMDPGVPLFDGKVNLQIIGGTTTKLEGIVWPFAGGELVVLPATFEANMDIDDVETIIVEARHWELENLIETLRVPDLHATGTISGRFPIDIEGANIMIRDAVLQADEKGGKLAYTGDVVDVVKGQNTYADYAFEALTDLDYSVMRVGANGNLIGEIVVTADLLGKSKDVLGGAEFKFGLSVDSHLSQLLHSATNASRETYIAEAFKLRDAKKQGETP